VRDGDGRIGDGMRPKRVPRLRVLAPPVLVAFIALVPSAFGARRGPTPPLRTTRRWITDARGRAVILRGVNMVFKRPPYYPAAGGPMAVAGTPAGYSYDRDSNTFALSYSTRAPGGRRLPRAVQTTVFVPRLHYPRGYAVRVTGARVTSAPRSRYLLLRRLPGARSVSV
jgi:hypothetical protein